MKHFISVFLIGSLFLTHSAWSADGTLSSKPDKEEDDFSNPPFTEYGSTEAANEEEDLKFFQYGRLFGASLGLGFESIDGNRGSLWQGGFPLIDVKVHYWFTFNIALDMGVFSTNHFFDTSVLNQGHVSANMIRLGVDLKYYFDTTHLSAPISFSNPYVLFGVGSFTKTQTSFTQPTPDAESSVGLSLGAGLEFMISPKKTYFEVEAKMHVVNFVDTYTTQYQTIGLSDLTGRFYTITGNFLFTW